MTIDIKHYSGQEMQPAIEVLREFRLRYFREFPYLYVGTQESEQKYLGEYLANPSARLFVAQDNDETVGVGIGILLSSEKDILESLTESLGRYGLNSADFFYIGEMIFAPEYRGRGIGKRMFDMLKKAGNEQGATRFCFLAVDRDADDPRRPPSYVDSAMIFQKLGFQKTPIQVAFDWPTIQKDGSAPKIVNMLSLWTDKNGTER